MSRRRKCPRCDSVAFLQGPNGYNQCQNCGRQWKAPEQQQQQQQRRRQQQQDEEEEEEEEQRTPNKRALKQPGTAEQQKRAGGKADTPTNNITLTAKKKRRQSASQSQVVLPALTKRGIEILKRPQKDDMTVMVLALDVFRYMVDQQVKRALRIDNVKEYEMLKDAFDMLVCDGDTKCNVSLHPQLYSHLSHGLVQPLSVIRITGWKNWYNELEVKDIPSQVVLVTSVEVLSYGSSSQFTETELRSWEKKPFNALCNEHDKQTQRPLFGSRGYYVHMLSDATVHFEERSIDFPEEIDAETIKAGVFLQELAEQFLHPKKQKRQQKAEQPTRVYGRVMRKSAVNHFAKATDEKGSYPMNFSFFIGDDSGEVRVVCWNNVCRQVFASVDIGDIVCVENFVVKRAFYDAVVQPLNNTQPPKREYIELAVNPSNPAGRVWKLPDGDRDIHDLFPLIDNNIIPLDVVPQLADMTLVDLYGIVNFVGRIQVEHIPRQAYSAWRQKECYRWIKLMDEHHNEVACKVYANTQYHTFANEILEGQVIFLKEFRVHSMTPTAQASDRIVWCSSTPYSRVYALATNGNESEVDVILGSNTMQYVRDNGPVMVDLLEHRLQERGGFGETIHVPIVGSIDLYREAFPLTGVIQLRELAAVEEKLDLFECRSMFLHHFIVELDVWPKLQHTTELEPVADSPGQCVCRTGDRVVYVASIRDLNDSHSEQVNFSVDLDNLVQWTPNSASDLLCALFEQYGIPCDTSEIRSFPQLVKRLQGVRCQSLLSLYRKSYTEVERNLVLVATAEEDN